MPTTMLLRALITSTAALLLLAGCGGTLPPPKHVTLSPPQTQRRAAQPSHWKVRRVEVPEYLDNYDIQRRTDDYVIDSLHDAKWTERLPAAITHLLQQSIDQKLQANRDRHYSVHVAVATFEPLPSGKVVLAARWRVTNGHDDIVAQDDTLIRKPLPLGKPSAENVGRTMSEAVRELAAQIVAKAS